MNRRGFLTRAGGAIAAVAAAGAVVQAKSHPDDFRYRGYRVCWGGWKEPVDQHLTFGVWFAIAGDGTFRYMTTMGSGLNHYAHEMDVLDLAWKRGEWPPPWDMVTASDAARDAVKRRACQRLLEAL